jgi:N-methylhydantoinase A/oxoprolinase/acetone carboxylase beta subunit
MAAPSLWSACASDRQRCCCPVLRPAWALCGEALATQDLLSMAIGGTSCDVTLISKGGTDIAPEFDLGGYHVALPSVDLHSIGAAGGPSLRSTLPACCSWVRGVPAPTRPS